MAIALLSLLMLALIAPFARVPLVEVPAFIPCYEAALIVLDLVTAALLLGQFAIARLPALLVLGAGYLFTALMTAAHALTFPGLFSETGLLGAGPQSTAWLYMFWHGGFPAAVLGYALSKRARAAAGSPAFAIGLSATAILALVLALTSLATSGAAHLPGIMQGNGYTSAMIFVVGSVWFLIFAALLFLWLERPHSVLDLWLIVVLCVWLCDVALSAVLNAGRFDLGFYAGRIYGLAAASCVLVVLLLETIALYARLARSLEAESRERELRMSELRSELIHVSRLSELGQMVSALAHEVTQPLAAIGNYLRAGERLVQLGDAAKARAALTRAADEAVRAGVIIRRLRDFVRKTEGEKRVEDLRLAIEEAVSLAMVAAERSDVGIELRLDPNASAAIVDKVQIQQVLLNLIRNAIEAMAESLERRLVIATAASGDDMVAVSVADRGPGLSAAVREKLFQPFVTTKSGGMGVGLSICRSIVEAHGGRLWAEENPGGGTVFSFTVPRAVQSAHQTAAE
jgi:two-component system, sensor histidine kinase and response regulator